MTAALSGRLNLALLAIALAGLLAGAALALNGRPDLAARAWLTGVLPVLLALVAEILASLRRGEVGLDIVAALSMTAALWFGETLAAAIVALMYAGGTFLETYAEGRARRDMSELLARVPRTATRKRDGTLTEVPLDAIEPGDILLVRRGEVAPVDGTVAAGTALLDQSALTGEAMPVRLGPGAEVLSGSANAGEPFDLRATRRAADSTYAGIIRLVEAAQRSNAPMARLADRYALVFLAATVALAAAAWYFAGDPIRAVAVLVVATPCPLILAVPVALVGGLSREARVGVLVKGARHLESLASVRSVVLDKTGTLTLGQPRLVAVLTHGAMTEDEALRLAASLDQASRHPMAQAIVAEAAARGLSLPLPAEVAESPGDGVTGRVGDREVAVGGTKFVAARCGQPFPAGPPRQAGNVLVALAVDGRPAATLVMADPLREGTAPLLAALRGLGVERILLATGDRPAVADAVARGLGLDAVLSGLTPDQKVLTVLAERRHGPVMMVGDGVNDAPALAAADVGVAMGARGAAATAEAADVVLLVDRLDRVLPGIEIAQRTLRIARQSVFAGIGLSVACMIAAALGHLSPVQGAVLQEAIDVTAILNALRVLRIRPRTAALPA